MAVETYAWVRYHARQTPDKTALVDVHSGRSFSYAQMQERTLRLAHALRHQLGVEQGDRVAFLSNNTTDFFELEFACLELGAVCVPLNWRLTVPELEYIVRDAAPKVLVHEDFFAESAHALEHLCAVPRLLELNASGRDSAYEAALSAAEPALERADTTHDDLWMIMYTSGTTGHPKGAMITYGMVFWNAVNASNPHALSADMVNLCVLPLFHAGGLNLYCNPAVHMGGTNVIMRAFDPEQTLRLLQDRAMGVTHFMAVPTVYLVMSQAASFEKADLSHITCCGIGGGPTPVELLGTYAERGKALQQAYGMTETGPLVTALDAAQAPHKIGSAGLPVLHARVRIVDEDGVEVKEAGTVGELWVSSPSVTPGYWNRPDATAEAFTDGWLHTGDAARADEDGHIYIVDRWKDMFVSGGENVYPAEVENVIYQIPEVAEVAVVGLKDERWGEVGCAVIVVKAGETLDEAAVLAHCRERLARFKQPRSVRFVAELPHNAAGKVLKRELREQGVD